MAPFRNRDRSNRSGRGQIEHNVLEGLPITQYREADITIEPHSVDAKPLDKDAWPELPMPRDSHMLPEHSQQILRAARSGRVYKPPAPPEDDNEMKDEEEESKEIRTGFTIKKYVKVPRHLEVTEPEYLAKRRKGLPSPYVQTTQVVAQPVLRETKVKKLDAEGNVSVYKVLVPEGQVVEGEVQPTDAAIEVAPATAVPGTIVEGVGVVNAEGVIVANDIMQQTPPRRRAPPPKKKRGGPGRGRKRVNFAQGARERGASVSNASGDMLGVPNVKREGGSVAPSDGGDTPMGDAGGDDEEGSGEEGSEDEDQDMERTSTPATPLVSSTAPTSAPAMDTAALLEKPPTEVITAPTQASATTSAPSQDMSETARAEKTVVVTSAHQTVHQAEERDPSSSPDLPLSSISHSRQNSLNQIPTPLATTDAVVPEETPSELPAPTVAPPVEAETAPEPIVASAPEPKPEPESVPEPAPAPATEPAPVPESAPESAPQSAPEPVPTHAPESATEPVDSEMVMHSAPASEPDLMGSLERQLEKDNQDMTES